ncbi:hypothetical protein F4679DRAFT_573153 [Xylaria curta]|nr:hypothetical protein F4679DRAFT_573153 [Xylaria curta]
MTAADRLQQPDFHALSGYLQGMSIEFSRFSNLAAVREVNAVDDMAQLTTNLNDVVAILTRSIADVRKEVRKEMQTFREEMRREMREEMQDMRSSMEGRLEDVDYNNKARALNSMAIKAECTIRPLKNITTREVVALPQTMKQLNELRVGEVEGDLEALGQVPVGSEEEKKIQLKEFLGISS